MNEYELLVSEVQKKAPVIETDLLKYWMLWFVP